MNEQARHTVASGAPSLAFLERVPMLSVHPDAATRDDVAMLAAELMEARRLLCLVWNHMHGQNMDGSKRPWPGDEGCAANWNKLSDAIGTYLDTPPAPVRVQPDGAAIRWASVGDVIETTLSDGRVIVADVTNAMVCATANDLIAIGRWRVSPNGPSSSATRLGENQKPK